MNRTRLIFLGVTVVFLALLAIGGLRLTKSYAVAREAREARESAFGNLRQLYEANPFPSMDNAERMRQDVAKLMRMRDAFTNAVSNRDVGLSDLSPSRFMQALQTSIRDRLLAQAPIIEGSRVVVPNFSFGFERYLVAGAPIPKQQDVPRLAQQLAMIENLVNEVYAAQIGSLRAIKRDEFDAVGGGGGDDKASSRVSRRRSRREAVGASAASPGLIRTPFYRAQRFTIEVSGRQAAICDLLNRLAAMNMFVIVTDLELSKRSDDLRPPAASAASIPGSVVAPGSVVTPEETVSTLPPSQRLVSGVEIDPTIDARIELEVCNFTKREGV